MPNNTGWQEWPDELGAVAVAAAIRQLAERNPEFFSRFDYQWASDPESYEVDAEAVFQLELLIVLSEMSSDHPHLANHRPTVVRILPIFDLASTSVSGDLCDYIVVPSPHFSLIREFAVLLKSLHAGASELSALDGVGPKDDWVHTALVALSRQDPGGVTDLLAPLQRHAVHLWQGVPSVGPEQLHDWLERELDKKSLLAREIAQSYLAMDRFLFFHELAHLLAGDLYGGQRTLKSELAADARALDLMTVRIGAGISDHPGLERWGAPIEDLFLGPTYLHLLRLNLLFVSTYRATAYFADAVLSEASGSIIRHSRESLEELETRLAQIPFVLRTYGLDELGTRTFKRTASFHALYNVAALKLLRDADLNPGADDLGSFDFLGPMEQFRNEELGGG